MTTLKQYYNGADADADRGFLESRGVPCYVKSGGRYVHGCGAYVLVLLFEQQYEDALALLQNPEHEVQHTIDMDLLNQIEASGSPLKAISKFMIWATIGVIVLFVVLAVVLVR